MSATIETTTRRFIRVLLWPVIASVVSACLLASTLPQLSLPWLALPALAGLLWSWKRRRWQDCAALGFLAGMVYFSFAYRWFGETAGSVVGWFAPFLVLGPALLSAWTFSLTAVCQWLAIKYVRSPWVTLATAAAFTATEGLRSIGPLANPFAAIAFPHVTTIYGGLAPFLGAGGVTFALVLSGGYLAEWIAKPLKARHCAIGLACIAAALMIVNLFAPARHLPKATTPVAVIQGNIRQELKWTPGALDMALGVYEGLTKDLRADSANDATRPQLVVWPETVIPTDLAASPQLQEQFRALAASVNTTLVVGALERRNAVPYNTLWFIDKNGVARVYRKRQLVPFAETLPAPNLLGIIPLTRFVSRFGSGVEASVIPVADRKVAPLICWESEFPALIAPQVAHGADVLIISTDDAWFGATDGPYQHAQIAQMRALETGRWVVRAAATGISGIIAPDGTFTQRSVLNTIAVIRGAVGDAVDTPFNHLGANAVLGAMIALYAIVLYCGFRSRRRGAG